MLILNSLSIEQSHGDSVLGGYFFVAGFVRSNELACATRVNNVSAVVGWFKVGNLGVTRM